MSVKNAIEKLLKIRKTRKHKKVSIDKDKRRKWNC
jgi:hypothetical protein